MDGRLSHADYFAKHGWKLFVHTHDEEKKDKTPAPLPHPHEAPGRHKHLPGRFITSAQMYPCLTCPCYLPVTVVRGRRPSNEDSWVDPAQT